MKLSIMNDHRRGGVTPKSAGRTSIQKAQPELGMWNKMAPEIGSASVKKTPKIARLMLELSDYQLPVSLTSEELS